MPRTLVRAPGHDRTRSLGWLAIAWIEFLVLQGPGAVQGQRVRLGDEFAGFILDCYALDARGRRYYDATFFSRPKGSAKSGLAGMIGLFEALGPARFLGFARGGEVYHDPWGLGFRYVYEPGEPMGQPVHVPVLRIMATEEGQTGNVFDTIYYNLTEETAPLYGAPGVDAGRTRIYLPGGGEILPSTASASSKDGGRETWVCFDESHRYNTPILRDMYATVTQNLVKRKLSGTWFLETTTMFAPGEDSVAEVTYREAELIRTGRKRGRVRQLFDHRWGECADLTDEPALRAAIVEAFGDAIQWNDLDGIVDQIYSLRAIPSNSRRFFLNAETSSSDAWIAAKEWDALADPDKHLADRDVVTLGLDASISGDSTCLVACRVSDGHLELLGYWLPADSDDGRLDRVAVDAAVAAAMARFRVVGFYADPPHIQDYLDKWTAEFGDKLKVRASQARPLEWWTARGRPMVSALERFFEAVRGKSISYTPAPEQIEGGEGLAVVLRRHVLNARRRPSRAGLQIGKRFPKSLDLIDAAVAAVLAYECRADAIAGGVNPKPKRAYRARRIR
ncbi:hypothetical protein [Actinoplanes sp. NPDC026623]|uniref:hypothetical protein n=1 Tax=Actinoplanes sp. NPDC026623 TaxID=3155610 RepID=UPI0033EB134A